MINIVYAFDNNYVLPFSVSVYSLLKNTSTPEDIHIYGLCNNVTDTKNINKINKVCNSFGAKFTTVDTKIDNLDTLKTPERDNYITVAMYIRLYIHDLIPELNRCIYLDCDTLVCGDIVEMWNVNLDRYVLGACYEEGMSKYSIRTYGFDKMDSFNSGVLLLDLVKYREQKILDKLLNVYEIHHEKFNYPDQEMLNLLFHDNRINLSPEWNVYYAWADDEDRKRAKLLHYIMANKPWNDVDNPMFSSYKPYYNEYVGYEI